MLLSRSLKCHHTFCDDISNVMTFKAPNCALNYESKRVEVFLSSAVGVLKSTP